MVQPDSKNVVQPEGAMRTHTASTPFIDLALMTATPIHFRPVESDADLLACHPMVRQLRPHLASPEAFQQVVAEQRREGYRTLVAWRHDAPCGFAGYRLQRNLIHGRFLYVDDLVTTQDERGGGVGSALLGALKALAREAGCTRLTLDTGLDNALAQRFYFRNGLLARGLHFGFDLR